MSFSVRSGSSTIGRSSSARGIELSSRVENAASRTKIADGLEAGFDSLSDLLPEADTASLARTESMSTIISDDSVDSVASSSIETGTGVAAPPTDLDSKGIATDKDAIGYLDDKFGKPMENVIDSVFDQVAKEAGLKEVKVDLGPVEEAKVKPEEASLGKQIASVAGGIIGGIIGGILVGVGLAITSPVAFLHKGFRQKWNTVGQALNLPRMLKVAKGADQLKKFGFGRKTTTNERTRLAQMKAKVGKKGDLKSAKHPHGAATEIAARANSSPEAKASFLRLAESMGIETKGMFGSRSLQDIAIDIIASKQNEMLESGFEHFSRSHEMTLGGSKTTVSDVVTPTTNARVSSPTDKGVSATNSKFKTRDKMPTSGTHKKQFKSAGNLQETQFRAGRQDWRASRHGILGTKKANPAKVKIRVGGSVKSITDLQLSKPKDGISESADRLAVKKELKRIANPKIRASLEKLLDSDDKKDIKNLKKKLAHKLANQSKAKDLIRAAILQHIEQKGIPESGGSISINLSSVSLVTPDDLRSISGGGEKPLLADQREALADMQLLSAEEKAELLSEFMVGDPAMALPEGINLEISTETFNFGVNEGEVLGRDNQKDMNLEAFGKMSARATSMPDGDAASADKKAAVGTLLGRLNTLIQDPSASANRYLAPTLVMVANHLMEGQSAFNCASGKDRTGMEDVFMKFFFTRLEAAGPDESLEDGINRVLSEMDGLTELGEAEPTPQQSEMQAQFRELLMHSPNLDIQQKNTGVPGYKLVGESNEDIFKSFSGLKNSYSFLGFAHLAKT